MYTIDELKAMISEMTASGEWSLDTLSAICEAADMADEWAAADGDTFETVAYAAAEKLGIDL